jgi:retron-type reverse transcriptase
MKKRDVLEFQLNLEDNLFDLHEKLKNKTYQHSHYIPFYITDPKLRHIHKATVKDRILHHAIFRILYPIFDKIFIFDSYSCRLNKGTHKAVKRLKRFCLKLSQNNRKIIFVLKCDIRKFFDSVNQDILLNLIKKKIKDEKAVWLIEKIVKSFINGLPLGNVTSQLFANIYLNELDYFIKQNLRERYYLRYCDDFIILSDDKNYLIGLVEKINDFLNKRLKLKLHLDKIIMRKYRQGIDFVGYVIRPHCITLRTRTKKRIFKKVKHNNLQSYLGILKHCKGYKIKKKIEELVY